MDLERRFKRSWDRLRTAIRLVQDLPESEKSARPNTHRLFWTKLCPAAAAFVDALTDFRTDAADALLRHRKWGKGDGGLLLLQSLSKLEKANKGPIILGQDTITTDPLSGKLDVLTDSTVVSAPAADIEAPVRELLEGESAQLAIIADRLEDAFDHVEDWLVENPTEVSEGSELINTTSEPPREIVAALGRNWRLVRLFRYLWQNPLASYAQLEAEVWKGDTIQPATIAQTANRLGEKLWNLGHGDLQVKTEGNYVKLDR